VEKNENQPSVNRRVFLFGVGAVTAAGGSCDMLSTLHPRHKAVNDLGRQFEAAGELERTDLKTAERVCLIPNKGRTRTIASIPETMRSNPVKRADEHRSDARLIFDAILTVGGLSTAAVAEAGLGKR
jgi:hypothetical protein